MERLLCNYDFEDLKVELSKKELIKGFTKIDNIDCFKELNPSSLWFTLIRNGKQSKTQIIKYEEREKIPELLRGLEKGDIVNFTITINNPYLQRRDKMIAVK